MRGRLHFPIQRSFHSLAGKLGGKSTSEAKAAAVRRNGLKGGRPPRKKKSHGQASSQIKPLLVAAHRAKDWDLAKSLSQAKEKAKTTGKCCDCGKSIATHRYRSRAGVQVQVQRCRMCSVRHRFYAHAIC